MRTICQIPDREIVINTLKFFFFLCLTILVTGCQAPLSKPAKSPTDHTFGRYEENLEQNLILITMTSGQYDQLTDRKPVPVVGELPAPYADFINTLNAKYALKRVANWPLAAINIFCVVFELQNPENRDAVIIALQQEPGVETAQLVQTFATQSQNYNDPYLSLQHGVHSIQAIGSHLWSRGEGVRVAIIDTGIDDVHSELLSSIETTKNFVDSNEEIFRSDVHGTAVGGVIAANANNKAGMVGIAPDSKLLALKACWQSRQNVNKAICNSLTLAKAINYSIQKKVDIINLSLTGPPDPVLERLVLKALAQNIVVIGAKPTHNNRAFPISIPGTIVAAMPKSDVNSISAPGRRVLSIGPDEQYDFFDGSSFSTAHISGLAALIRSISPMLTPAELLALLERTANSETGVVNACRAVEWVSRLTDKEQVHNSCN